MCSLYLQLHWFSCIIYDTSREIFWAAFYILNDKIIINKKNNGLCFKYNETVFKDQ